ncbi:pheromone receptor 1 [Ophiostoma piceae UAMH 11346]|uniref:Pheromone receptor 1 n=1 Tax=Ophiostoma piceae (strain UAMH 11346) TaxID=1262450 RepID=S3CLB3_OPHP1|nr:pheromone receptor 1 [Ophiostoma piceae UAMH 11346]
MDITAYVTDGGTLVLGRGGHVPSPPALVANVVLRLILCPLALLLTIVPLRMLWKNGEFPAVVFVLCTNIMTLFVFVNAAIWHNQDFDNWWLGYGWCDLQAYVDYSLTTAYSACVCAIMQRLSSQLGLTRVSSLSPRERRNQLILQAAIIFPVPVLQAAITIFVQGIRYAIIPGGGCTVQYNATPVVLVFFVLPPTIFTLIACFHTFQVYRKFREVDVDCRAALAGTNTVAFLRRQRARRKLYFMVMCILIPYTPLTITFCAINIIGGWPWNYPADYFSNHFGGPNPWNTIIVFGYSDVSFMTNNLGWIPVVSSFIAFIFFGTSKEAINVHRQYMLALGLGHLFPRLYTPYDPDRSGAASLFDSTASTAATQLTALTSTCDSRKGSIVPQNFSVPAASPGLSEAGSQSNFLAAIVSRDDGDILQRPPPSTFRRWYSKAQSISLGSRHADINMDHELERGIRIDHRHDSASPVPAATSYQSTMQHNRPAPTRTPFNPGLNWLAPLTANTSFARAPKWKPVVFGQRTHRKVESEGSEIAAPFPVPPSSSSTAPIVPATHEPHSAHALSIDEAVPARPVPFSPFDGTTLQGQRTVSTHVWSGGEEGAAITKSSITADIGGDAGNGEPQQPRRVVHVERCITSQVTR